MKDTYTRRIPLRSVITFREATAYKEKSIEIPADFYPQKTEEYQAGDNWRFLLDALDKGAFSGLSKKDCNTLVKIDSMANTSAQKYFNDHFGEPFRRTFSVNLAASILHAYYNVDPISGISEHAWAKWEDAYPLNVNERIVEVISTYSVLRLLAHDLIVLYRPIFEKAAEEFKISMK